MSALDLDTPLWMTLTIAGIAWGTLGIVCLRLWRKGDHRDRANERRGPRVHGGTDRTRLDAATYPDARAARARAPRLDRGVYRDRGSRDSAQRDQRIRLDPVRDAALARVRTELVALARYLQHNRARRRG